LRIIAIISLFQKEIKRLFLFYKGNPFRSTMESPDGHAHCGGIAGETQKAGNAPAFSKNVPGGIAFGWNRRSRS
jgi:predicted cupin superfamily sugar epimerase